MEKETAKTKIKVKDNLVGIMRIGDIDYISLTDLARYKNPIEPKDVVKNWLRAKTNIEYLALWEQMHNPNVKGVEIDTFKNEAGTHYFTMSPQRWIKETNAIGIVSKSGNNGGTYAHPDIAFELNVALFGKTAKEWKEENPELNGNMRDYANILQLVILSNLENINLELIKQGISQKQRLERLNEIAKRQGEILQNNNGIKQIEGFENTKLLK